VVLAFEGAQQRKVAVDLIERAFRAAGGVPGDLEVIIETPEGNPGPALTEIAPGGWGCARRGKRTRPPSGARRSWLGQRLLRQAFALPGHRRRGQPPALWRIGSGRLMVQGHLGALG
jgi:hypothetical protein